MATQTVETLAGAPLPEKYARIEQVPAGPPPAGRLRLLLHGMVGSGKTTFCCSTPRAMLFDFERKSTAVRRRDPNLMVVHYDNFDDYAMLLDELFKDGHAGSRAFDTIIFDPVTSWVNHVRTKLTGAYKQEGLLKGIRDLTASGKDGAGWGDVNFLVNQSFTRVHDAGYGWIACCHWLPSWKKRGDQEIMVPKSILNDGVLTYLYKECEYAATIRKSYKTEDVAVGEPTKTRLPDGTIIEKAVEKRSETRTKYWLDLKDDEGKVPIRQHVPIAGDIEILPGQGFPAFATAYATAVEEWQNGS